MSDEETITVADVSDGPAAPEAVDPGESVDIPAVEVLTGRGFVTGKSGSGKSNSASVVIEKLLDNSFPVLIVDSDGEYYGLKEEYEILHAGADEECDIQVSPEHAEKLATLALEENVPIILDVSGYLDEDDASELILEVAKQLFAKEKKLKKPFLMLVEECHEYIPEGAGMDETGKMLIKIGKRGRKHGLGIVGISQRPADVKKDFITQCDWLVWHRLTWDNDTKVVGRILGSEYASAIEDMGDGEAFLMTDWDEHVRRVQFHRKQTFDAGATPGLDDFERPDLKSVSGDLVSELEGISDEQARRESELADLRQELDKKRQRIEELKRDLEEARDMSRMADEFAQALLQKAEAPYRAGPGADTGAPDAQTNGATGQTPNPVPDASEEYGDRADDADSDADADGNESEDDRRLADDQAELEAYEVAGEGDVAGDEDDGPSPVTTVDGDPSAADGGDGPADADATGGAEPADAEVPAGDGSDDHGDGLTLESADPSTLAGETGTEPVEREKPDPLSTLVAGTELGSRDAVVAGLSRAVQSLDPLTRDMLAHYQTEGASTPVDAHVAAGGDGDRGHAYARNRTLRRASLVEHAARGQYRYALPSLVAKVYPGASRQKVADAVAAIEEATGLATVDAPEPERA
ncbi:MAG: helicase HerA domain-containing protein [Halolamina sp.]